MELPEETISTAGDPVTDAISQLSPEEQQALMEQYREYAAEQERLLKEMLDGLGNEIQGKFHKLRANRATKENEWLESMRMYLGHVANSGTKLTYDNPFASKKGGSGSPRAEFDVVRTKCDIAIGQLQSMQFAGGDKNWDIGPSPVSSDSAGNPLAYEQASRAAAQMERAIEDQLTRCNYAAQCREAIKDRVILGTAVMKGPMNALSHKKKYRSVGGQAQAYLEAQKSPSVVRVNPWFFYPDDSVINICDAEYAIEAHPMSRPQLLKLAMSSPEFQQFQSTILDILKEGPVAQGKEDSYADFTELTANNNAFKDKYVVLEYHGPIEKDLLDALSIELTYTSPNNIYYGEVWVCQGKIIRVALETLDASYSVPYAVCVWESDPSSIFGIGLPTLVSMQQKVINSTYQMILDNAANSAGPQIIMDKEAIEPADGDWTIRPFKIWYYTDQSGTADVSKAMQFLTVPNETKNIMPVMDMTRNMCEEESGIPIMNGGLQSPEVGDSATGMAIMQQASTTVLDYKNEDWDDNITERIIHWFHDWNWEYNPDQTIKGDFEIDVTSSSEYRNKLQHIKNLEKLSVEASQNPAMGDLLNMQEVQRARLYMMNLPAMNLVKTDEEIKKEAEARAQQPNIEMLEIELKKAELEVKKMELQFKSQELQFKAGAEQQKFQMEYEERMANQAARVQEAHANVLSEQMRYQTEMAKLAQKEGVDREKIMADMAKTNIVEENKKFLKGIDAANQVREQALQVEEIKLKRETGGGALSTV